MTNSEAWGMQTLDGTGNIPLEGVRIVGEILGRSASLLTEQRFRNKSEKPVEAVYKFPLPEGSAIAGFEVTLSNGKVIKGDVEERNAAFVKYDQALEAGNGGYLLDQERPNIFTLSVGNLNPGMEATVAIKTVQQLVGHGKETRLCLPTTIAPRYLPAIQEDNGGIPEAELITPEYASDVPYGLQINLRVAGREGVYSIESPSHVIRQRFAQDAIEVEFTAGEAIMDRDFILTVEARDEAEQRAYLAKDKRGSFLSLDLALETGEKDGGAQEFVFLLDNSGSMGGSSLDGAKRSLEVSLRALPQNCTFNVCVYNSNYYSFFPKPALYSESTLQEALDKLRQIRATGGTDLLPALKYVLDQGLTKGRRRSVLLLTDGDIGNERAVFAAAGEHSSSSKVFTIGIGYGPNEYLLRQLARSTGATSEMIAPGEEIEKKTLRLFRKLAATPVTDLKIDWGQSAKEVRQAPLQPQVFAGEASTVFARMPEGAQPQTISVRWTLNGVPFEKRVTVELAQEGASLPALWAREAIRDLEEGITSPKPGSQQRRTKEEASTSGSDQELIDLSKEYGVLCGKTSFIAVEERSDEERTTDAPVLVKVPVLVTKDWGRNESVNLVLCQKGMGSFSQSLGQRQALYASAVGATLNSCDALFSCSASSGDASWLNSEQERGVMPATGSLLRSKRGGIGGQSAGQDHGQFVTGMSFHSESAGSDQLSGGSIMYEVLRGQQALGGFQLSEALLAKIGITSAQIGALADQLVGVPRQTAELAAQSILVLEWLEAEHGAAGSTWQPLVAKTRSFLSSVKGAAALSKRSASAA